MPGLNEFLAEAARLLMGAAFLLNGVNWWFKLITPYPSRSDFVKFHPPGDMLGTMIENGVMFQLVKAIELVAGLCLLANFMVPLVLVIAVPVAVPIFIVDVFFVGHLRGQVMGWGTLVLNTYLLLVNLGSYHGLLAVRTVPAPETRAQGISATSAIAEWIARFVEPTLPILGVFAVLLGAAMVVWLLAMIVAYLRNPLPLSALYPLKPRS